MNLTIAVNEKWGVGKDGGFPTHLPEGIKYFRETIKGRTVVMGRRTLEGFPGGKPLKDRVNIVFSRGEAHVPEGIQAYHSVEDVPEALKDCREEDAFIIGGGMIYREFLPYCSKTYVAYIYRAFDVGTTSENPDQDESWRLESVSGGREHKGVSFEFRVYRRVR